MDGMDGTADVAGMDGQDDVADMDRMDRPGRALLTVGHGTLGTDDLAGLLREAGVDLVVDIRRFPGSRRHPHLARDRLAADLPPHGVEYRWEERLGGRRAVPPGSPDTALRNAAFRGYAAHMRSPEFLAAVEVLLREAAERGVAVMCSESVWWRCHRRLVADHAALVRGVAVAHLMHDGRTTAHPPTDGVRLRPDGLLGYDAGADSLPWEPRDDPS
jgi:uncharacterized protein (DUF488 family)